MNMKKAIGVIGCAAWLAFAPVSSGVGPDPSLQVAELTPDVEKAIKGGLDWLVKSQAADGSWGAQYKTASTALGLMAFMVKGHFPDKPPHGETLSKAVSALVAQAAPDSGYLGRSMYEHGLATLALSEVWGMSGAKGKTDVGATLKSAVTVILKSQHPGGGWRYNPAPTDADLSVTVMQIVALASAKEAGILVPDTTLDKAVRYVLSCRHAESGGFCYQPGGGPSWVRTGAGVLSLMMSGQRDNEAVKTGLEYLLKQPGSIFSGSEQYFYGHYYSVQAMYQAGDRHYRDWYPQIRDALLKKQAADGRWEDGEGIATPIAILVLGVPYRFLPIYQR